MMVIKDSFINFSAGAPRHQHSRQSRMDCLKEFMFLFICKFLKKKTFRVAFKFRMLCVFILKIRGQLKMFFILWVKMIEKEVSYFFTLSEENNIVFFRSYNKNGHINYRKSNQLF